MDCLRLVLGPHSMLLHACAKTLNFVEKGILVILLSQRPNSQRKAPFQCFIAFSKTCFGASQYVFACLTKNHNIC